MAGVGVGAGTLAYTGANVTGWIVLGVVLLVAGIVLVLVARRRHKRARTDAGS